LNPEILSRCFLALIEALQTGVFDRGNVDEHILAAALRLNETIALLRIKLLDRTRTDEERAIS
jgi:hypothetical protein